MNIRTAANGIGSEGRLVYAMFEHGFSRAGQAEAPRNRRGRPSANKGFTNGTAPAGQGQGSAFYSGSAGSLAEALFEGYFGFKIAKDSLIPRTKLGRRPGGRPRLSPGGGRLRRLRLSVGCEEDGSCVPLQRSNLTNRGKVKILVPWLHGRRADGEKLKKSTSAWTARRSPSSDGDLNDDAFVVVETDFKDHS